MSTTDTAYYSVIGILFTISHEKSFYYLACQKCKRKIAEEGGQFKCSHCGNTSEHCNVVYMFKMRLDDGTGCIWINVLGDLGNEIVGKTAEDLKKMKDSGDESYAKFFDDQKHKVQILPKLS
jgi:hypothetical protein